MIYAARCMTVTMLLLVVGCSYGWRSRTNITSGDFVLIDTTAMPAGSVDARLRTHSGSKVGKEATLHIKGPVKIIILPTTRPATGREIDFVGIRPIRTN